METSSNSVPHIPKDVILDIFCRLPVKSLVRFSSACKFWQSLINSNELLITSHMERSLKTNTNFPLIIYSKKSHDQSCNCHNPIIEIELLKKISLGKGYLCLPDDYILAGCCKGLLCVYKNCNCFNSKKIYLWNPALHQSRALPDSKILKGFTDLGFLFDCYNDDYKIVKIFMFQLVEIYSLKDNSWKSIDLTNTPMHSSYTKDFQIPVAFNEILHWLAFHFNRNEDTKEYSVIKFDIGQEKFEEILIPESIPLDYVPGQFGAFQGISLGCWLPEYECEVWIMKDEQDGGTAKSLKIFVPNYSDGRIQYSDIKGFISKGEILTDPGLNFVLYDSDRGICKGFGLGLGSSSANYFVVDFTESLIPVWPGAKKFL